jgi:glycosyltransferase involved in cell wall biosynthesis
MRIAIDGNEANIGIKVGISEYAFELLKQFRQFQMSDLTYEVYLKDRPQNDMPKEGERWQYRVFGPKKLWTQWRLPLDLYTHMPRPDVFFTPSHYAPRFSPVPTVISIMDVSYLRFPELFHSSDLYQLQHWTKYSVSNAKAVLTISNSSKNDIIKSYGIHLDRVHVIYPGIKQIVNRNEQRVTMKELKEKYGLSDNFILFVGTLQPRKNIERLIESFSIVLRDNKQKNLQLVIVGKKGWLYEPILESPQKYGVKDSVKFLDYIPDEDLPALYKDAICYVLPSLYEGFGLPVLEAMKYDCPVITSNVSSLPEAGGDAALYVDPTDVNNIADTIIKLIGNEKLREELIEKGRKQINKFSWEKAAKETLSVLKEVAKQ